MDSPREVYPPLFEALNWAHSLWDTSFRLVEPVGVGGVIVPFIGIKIIDVIITALRLA